MTNYNEIMHEIKQEIAGGQTLEDVQERDYEIVDNCVPVYNKDIITEWQNMPSEYDNRGSAELGHNCRDIDIIKLMSADLYFYYQDLVSSVFNDLSQELESTL